MALSLVGQDTEEELCIKVLPSTSTFQQCCADCSLQWCRESSAGGRNSLTPEDRSYYDSFPIFSPYFLVPKKLVGMRPWSWHIRKLYFWKLTIRQPLVCIQLGKWMISIDLTDAYFQMPTLLWHRKNLHFAVGEEIYQDYQLPNKLHTGATHLLQMCEMGIELTQTGRSEESDLYRQLADPCTLTVVEIQGPHKASDPTCQIAGFCSFWKNQSIIPSCWSWEQFGRLCITLPHDCNVGM